MNADAVELGFTVFRTIAAVSLQATACLGLIVALQWSLGHRMPARWRYALWCVLLARMVLPWSVPGFALPLPARAPAEPGAAVVQSPTVPIPPAAQNAGDQTPPVTGALAGTFAEPSDPARNAVRHAAGLGLPDWQAAVVLIWLVGVLGTLVYTITHHAAVVRTVVRSAEPPPEWIAGMCGHVKRELRLPVWPVLLVTDDLPSAVLIGALRPKILLPRRLAESSTPEEMRYYLLHEMLHIRGGDIWISWLWAVGLALHWFNPLLWWAGVRMAGDRELACDEWLVRHVEPNERPAYCSALLKAAEQASRALHPLHVLGLAGVVERKHEIERRLTMISRNVRVGRGGLIFAWISALLLAAVSFAEVSKKPVEEAARENLPSSEPVSSAPLSSVADEGQLADLREQAVAEGDLLKACDAEMARVALRRQNGHPYKDKIDLTDIYEKLKARSPEMSDFQKEGVLRTLESYAARHKDDIEYGWRVWQLSATVAKDKGDPARAGQYMARSIEAYPYVKYEIPSKHSKFQHLVNEMAMMIWDQEGLDAAEEYVRQAWKNDRRLMYFFDYPWRLRFAEEKLDALGLDEFERSLGPKPPLGQVTFLLTPDGPRYDGVPVSWNELEARLSGVANRRNSFLAMGITNDQMTVRTFDEAQSKAIRLVEKLGFAHFSYIGLQAPSAPGDTKD